MFQNVQKAFQNQQKTLLKQNVVSAIPPFNFEFKSFLSTVCVHFPKTELYNGAEKRFDSI